MGRWLPACSNPPKSAPERPFFHSVIARDITNLLNRHRAPEPGGKTPTEWLISCSVRSLPSKEGEARLAACGIEPVEDADASAVS